MRPLYIEGSPNCRVTLDDPALRIMVADKADQLFPLSRISRVVCIGVVDWTMSALLACADTGIHVIFLERNGEIRARWLGRSGERQDLTQRLLDLLARGDGQDLYGNWRLAMEKLAARSCARRLGVPDWRETPVKILREQINRQLPESGRQTANLLQSLLYADLLHWLTEAGYNCNDETLLSNRLDLAADFSRLLVWDFYPGLLGQKAFSSQMPADSAVLYNGHAERSYLLFRGCFNKLHQFLLAVS
ncbi:MAG: CRISPR-associated endonuclease Cas1 [Methylomonas sp.]|jgi:hypothetical protein